MPTDLDNYKWQERTPLQYTMLALPSSVTPDKAVQLLTVVLARALKVDAFATRYNWPPHGIKLEQRDAKKLRLGPGGDVTARIWRVKFHRSQNCPHLLRRVRYELVEVCTWMVRQGVATHFKVQLEDDVA